jgi:TonB-dependent SusC/RagA subfamily outer membrane receptor
MLSVLCLNSITAQKNNRRITITGKVMDVYNSPIVNAFVMIDGEKTNSMTDSNGKYKIKVAHNATKIGIVAFGNGIIEEKINKRPEINFKFKTLTSLQPSDRNSATAEDGINTGYSHVKKKYLTSDISKIDGTDKKYASYSSIYEMIQREVSGVKIYGETIVIQDSRDFYGYVPALLVIDGVYVDTIGDIPPTSVESIEVLKGTSAMIYGSRGYGGAIVIKTKTQN